MRADHGVELRTVGALGVSAMMHGYLAFDADDALLVGFRTWRNTTTGPASEQLSEAFGHQIPQRWSVAHLYQAILNGEEHVGRIAHLTTLAGYVHHLLTGQRVLGVGDASGMFPIDSATGSYHAGMLGTFDSLVADRGFDWRLAGILPSVLPAGEPAGTLTAAGAALLDPTGTLQPGALACPPEGDAGTGMVATNSVARRTGNVSAGTSIFAMVVLEHDLSRTLPELDLETPDDLRKVLRTQIDVVLPTGIGVLAAGDPVVAEMAALCDGEVIFFDTDPANAAIAGHCASGGRAVFVRDDRLVLAVGTDEQTVDELANIALARHDIAALLGGVAAAWAMGLSTELIRTGIETFVPADPSGSHASGSPP